MKGARRVITFSMSIVVALSTVVGCTNKIEEFCHEFTAESSLARLVEELNSGNLNGAKSQAEKLKNLSDTAPDEIRVDLQGLSKSVLDIIALLELDKEQGSVSKAPADSTTEVEQLRNQLNEQFDELDRRSARVTRWASEKCGINL